MPQPTLGVCYYPEHWPSEQWADDARLMVETGLTHVRIGEFAWSRLEPSRDVWRLEWLDAAIQVLADAGLKIVLCTPTATPPKWLVDEMPDMLAYGGDGQPRRFGSRRHYDFAHVGYRQECARIVQMLAERYGKHAAIVAWQTDNEYGCHDTTVSYGPASQAAFRDWLAQKYQSPEALNRAWGNVFWSMEVTDFEQIDLPDRTVTEPNPSHMLDFRRFASDMVVSFNRLQVDIIRKHARSVDVLHNFMGKYTGFDHHDVSTDLDVATWDSYPLGFLEQFGPDDAWKRWYLRAGDPDFQAFHHDLYRGMTAPDGMGRMWVMEQQPGPVNWAPWNPDPHPGMVRAWTHEAVAHGAEVVSYFRWRQAPFAQEQFHTGLNKADGTPDRGQQEAAKTASELKRLPDAETARTKVAMVFDYPSIWATTIQPQGADYDGFDLIMRFYRALRMAGQSVDILPASAEFSEYDLVVVPHLVIVPDGFVGRLGAARVLFGPRCGSRTAHHHIPENLGPGRLADLTGIRVERVESLRPGVGHVVGPGGFERWFEHLVPGTAEVRATTREGHPAWTSNGRISYLAGWPDEALAAHVVRSEVEAAGLKVEDTGDDLRVRDRGHLRTIINYGPREHDASHLIGQREILIGSNTLPVAGITVCQRG